MGSHLTITAIKDSGKVDNFGNHKCYVTFHDEDQGIDYTDVYAAFKTVPEVGVIRYGNVLDGDYGPRFKSEQLPEGEAPRQGTAQSAPQTRSKAPQGRPDNSDGMRQGMSINNAAKYVIESAVKDGITLDPQELADEIKRYAKSIYNIDLTVSVEDEVMDIMAA